jgi:carboxyl-terminal processing protease
VDVRTNRSDNVGVAGEPFELQVTVKNEGKAPLYELRALTRSDNRLFDERELVFGKLAPGQKRTWSTTLGVCRLDEETEQRECILPKTVSDRADGITVEFSELHGHTPDPQEVRVSTRALPPPQFAYTVQVADDARGNGDGRVQRGEVASVYLRVRNVGEGVSEDTMANLRSLAGHGVLLQAGRFDLDELDPGEEAMVAFTFEVLEDFPEDEAKLQVSVSDSVRRAAAGEKLSVPIAPEADAAPAPAGGEVVIRKGASVLERPERGAKVVATVAKAAVALPSQATRGDYTRVDLGEGRPGWVHRADLAPGAGGGGKLEDVLAHMPPDLEVQHEQTLATREPTLRVRGEATDDTIVRDLYIFVGPHKVFYQSNRNAKDPQKVTFDTNVPLRPGVNYVTVVARENNEVMSRDTFIVRRDAPDGSLLETPKHDDFDPFFFDGAPIE